MFVLSHDDCQKCNYIKLLEDKNFKLGQRIFCLETAIGGLQVRYDQYEKDYKKRITETKMVLNKKFDKKDEVVEKEI